MNCYKGKESNLTFLTYVNDFFFKNIEKYKRNQKGAIIYLEVQRKTSISFS